MSQWLSLHYKDLGYESVVFVFANTGIENEQTLEFVNRCDKHFNLNIQWVEADVDYVKGNGTNFYKTDYFEASRHGEPFEAVIKKYGIPNPSNLHCTRELKEVPIHKFGKRYFSKEKYHTAIGIREDEFDRKNPKSDKMGFIYPLMTKGMIPMNKAKINFFWSLQPFRLELKGYQGNCVTCWKKSDSKLFQIAKENPDAFDFMKRMEAKYPRVGSEFEKDPIAKDRVFFRKNRSANDILTQAANWSGIVRDDSVVYDWQESLDLNGGSCEVFSGCGD